MKYPALILLCAQAIAVALFSSQAQAAMVGHWTFDETSGAQAANNVPGGNDAVNTGGGISWVAGVVGNAVRLDGASSTGHDLRIDSIAQMSGAERLTISLWMKPAASQTGFTNYKGVVMTREVADSSGANRNWGIGYQAQSIIDSRISNRQLDSSADLGTKEIWYHVALVWDGTAGTHKLYVNGQANPSSGAATTATSIASSGAWYVGWDPSNRNRHFRGAIDDLAIWNDALTATDIDAVYNAGLVGTNAAAALCSGLSADITAASSTCGSSQGNVAFVPDAGGAATYAWTITNGTITSGDGTNEIVYTAGVSGSITLNCEVAVSSSGCSENSGDTFVTLVPSPTTSGVSGPASVSPSQTGVVYSVVGNPSSTYVWNVPEGAAIVSGATGPGNDSIVVDFGQYSGEVYVTETNTTGCSGELSILTVSTGIPSPRRYVSLVGDDSNPGTLMEPFRTIQHAANQMSPGESVLIREGVYRETVVVPISGMPSAPIVFEAFNDEEVVVSGGDLVAGWTRHAGDIWQAPNAWDAGIDGDGNTLFVDGVLKFEARQGAEGDPLEFNNWGQISKGNLAKTHFTANDLKGFGDDFWNGAKVRNHRNDWTIDTRTVADYESATGKITYDTPLGPLSQKHVLGYYIFDTINALDEEGEWYKDVGGQTLYYQVAPGKDPNAMQIEFRRRAFGFSVVGRDHIHLRGLTFRGCSIETDSDTDYNVYAGNKMYGYDFDNVGRFFITGTNNVFRDNEVSQTWTQFLTVRGQKNAVVNNYIHDIGYSGRARTIGMSGSDHLVSHNTVRKIARSFLDGYPLRTEFAYNLFEDGANLSWDTGVFDGDQGRGNGGGSIVHHNIFRDSPSIGIYMGFYSGTDLVIHHNLVHDVSPFTMRTGPHNFLKYAHNTFIGAAPIAGLLAGDAVEMDYNNNLQINMDDVALADMFIKGNHNYAPSDFVDFNGKDFRLAAGSLAIDSGVLMPGINDDYNGTAPDAGAFEFGEEPWQVGHDFDEKPEVAFNWKPLPGTNLFTNGQFKLAPSGWAYTGTTEWYYANGWNTLGLGLSRNGISSMQFNPGDGMSRVFDGLKPNTTYSVGVEARLADQLIQAEQFDSIQGDADIERHRNEDYVTGLLEDEWISFDGIDFGVEGKYDQLQVSFSRSPSASLPGAPATLEVRIDSPTGTVLGEFEYNPLAKGSWYVNEIDIPLTEGVKTVYLLPKGAGSNLIRIDSVRFLNSLAKPDQKLTAKVRDYGGPGVTSQVGYAYWKEEYEIFTFVTGPSSTSVKLIFENNGDYDAYLDRLALFEGSLDTVNVAPIGYPVQSTTLGSKIADNALDGTLTKRSSTKNRDDSWWQVDLGKPYDIYSLKLSAPLVQPYRLSNFKVSLWTNDPRDENFPVWENEYQAGFDLQPGEALYIKPTDTSVDGVTDVQMFPVRYVRVESLGENNHGTGHLAIAEIETLDYDELNIASVAGEIFVGASEWLVTFSHLANFGELMLLNVEGANYQELSNFKVRVWDRPPSQGGQIVWEKTYLPTTSVGESETLVIRGDEIADDGFTRLSSVLGRAVQILNNGVNVAGNNLLSLEDLIIRDALEVQPLNNVALLGRASQSSDLYIDRGKAIDAINSYIFPERDFTSTKNESGAWWQVELAEVAQIDQIVAFNRTDAANRLGNFRVSVWGGDPDSGGTELWGRNYSYSNGDIPAGGSLTIKGSDESGGLRLDQVAGAKFVRLALLGKNILSLVEFQVWTADTLLRLDQSAASFDFDLGTTESPVANGSIRVSPKTHGDVWWSGVVEAVDRGANPGVDEADQDFVSSNLPATLNIKLPVGTWNITVALGDATAAHDDMMLWAEGELISGDVDSAAGSFSEVTYSVAVLDGELNLQFDDIGGAGLDWAVTRVSALLAP